MSVQKIKNEANKQKKGATNSVKKKRKKYVNQELIEITRQAEKAGYGVSYGKFVQKNGL